MFIQSYKIEVLSPFFYSSYEGNVISTDGTISSTALTYALADYCRLRDKKYFLFGKEAITPNYKELADIPIFVTEALPKELKHTPVEFRSAMFWAEENIQINTQKNPYPKILEKANKFPFLKQVRRFVGVNVGSIFQTVIVSNEELGEEIFVNLGIRRSGELRLCKMSIFPKYVTLNYFLLEQVYEVPKKRILLEGIKIIRGGDYRLIFIHNIPFVHFKKEILPLVTKKWKSV